MEQAIDILKRSSLEVELNAKEKEVGVLYMIWCKCKGLVVFCTRSGAIDILKRSSLVLELNAKEKEVGV